MLTELEEVTAQVWALRDTSALTLPGKKKERNLKIAMAGLQTLAGKVFCTLQQAQRSAEIDQGEEEGGHADAIVGQLLDLQRKLETPVEWLQSDHTSSSGSGDGSDCRRCDPYLTNMCHGAGQLLESALRPWAAGEPAVSTVRYSAAQLRAVLVRVSSNLQALEDTGASLSVLPDSPALKKCSVLLHRALSKVLTNVNVFLFASPLVGRTDTLGEALVRLVHSLQEGDQRARRNSGSGSRRNVSHEEVLSALIEDLVAQRL